MENTDISMHLEKLAKTDPELAKGIQNAMAKLTAERDAADERARQSIIKDQRTMQQKAEDEILAERSSIRHYEMPDAGPRWMARFEFDRLTPRQKMDAVKAGIRIIS